MALITSDEFVQHPTSGDVYRVVRAWDVLHAFDAVGEVHALTTDEMGNYLENCSREQQYEAADLAEWVSAEECQSHTCTPGRCPTGV